VEYDAKPPVYWEAVAELPFAKTMSEYRFFDDTTIILEEGYHGFSFCLPTQEWIHSMKNFTTKARIANFVEALGIIYTELPKKLGEAE